MPVYNYVCRDCGHRRDTIARIGQSDPFLVCSNCLGVMRRDWANCHVGFVMGDLRFETHHNHSVGDVVYNRKDFQAKLDRKSDEMSERMGFEHRYRPFEGTAEDAGVTPDIEESVRTRQLAQGADRKLVL